MTGISALRDARGEIENKARPATGRGLVLLVLTALTALLVFGVCRTPGDGWFEDDPVHRVFVRENPRITEYFQPYLVSAISLGQSVIPWFAVSFRVDHLISDSDPRAAYLHQGLSLLATAFLLFLLAERAMPSTWALGATGLWLFLPSTIVIAEFLSTRHYLEGLCFAGISLLCGMRACTGDGPSRVPLVLATALFYLLACSAKEVYVTGLPVVLAAFVVRFRDVVLGGLISVCFLFYLGFRALALGSLAHDGVVAPTWELAVGLLEGWPVTWCGSSAGGPLALSFVALAVVLLVRGQVRASSLGWSVLAFGVALLTVLPSAGGLVAELTSLGPWYRLVFFVNTLALFLGAFLLSRTPWAAVRVPLGVAAGVLVVLGGLDTAASWDVRKADAELEATFYLEHEDRLLYSRLPAPWYLWGIHNLYRPGREPHYLTWRIDRATTPDVVLRRLDEYPSLWTKSNGTIEAAPTLAATIRRNLAQGITPLHREEVDDGP